MSQSKMRKWLNDHKAVLITILICSILYSAIFVGVMNMHDGHIDNPFNPETYDFLDVRLPSLPVVQPDKVPVENPDETIYLGTMLDDIVIEDEFFDIKLSRVIDETYDGVAWKADLGLDKYFALVMTMKYKGEDGAVNGHVFPCAIILDGDGEYKACDAVIRHENEWSVINQNRCISYDYKNGETYDVIFYCDRSKFMGNIAVLFSNVDRKESTCINIVRGE